MRKVVVGYDLYIGSKEFRPFGGLVNFNQQIVVTLCGNLISINLVKADSDFSEVLAGKPVMKFYFKDGSVILEPLGENPWILVGKVDSNDNVTVKDDTFIVSRDCDYVINFGENGNRHLCLTAYLNKE